MSDIELKRSLQEIKNNCRMRDDCDGCKFDTDYGCRFEDTPREWDLFGIHMDKWHTLYSWLVDIRAANAGMSTTELGADRMVRRHLLDDILEYMNELDEEE